MSSAGTDEPVRSRDSAATRRALLTAAQELFASEGYDRTTVRAVADRAGVNQALLFRYFGNKEGLFGEAVRGELMALLDSGPPGELLERTISAMFEPGKSAEPFLTVLRGAGSSGVGADLRAELGAAYTSAFASLVDTDDRDDAVARAELLLAFLLGITVMRSIPGVGTMLTAESASRHVRRASMALLDTSAEHP
ncbi:TetR family transcriptional regulator [Actinomycetes bacterium KLBMP 9759]